MNSPKSRFLELKQAAQEHRDTVDKGSFALATDLSLLQLIADLPHPENDQMAAANYYKIQGAVDYIKKLNTIGNETSTKEYVDHGNLRHKP